MSEKVVILYPILVEIDREQVQSVVPPSVSDAQFFLKYFPRFENLAAAMTHLNKKESQKLKEKYPDAARLTNKYDTCCIHCGAPLPIGHMVRWIKGVGSFHSKCYENE